MIYKQSNKKDAYEVKKEKCQILKKELELLGKLKKKL